MIQPAPELTLGDQAPEGMLSETPGHAGELSHGGVEIVSSQPLVVTWWNDSLLRARRFRGPFLSMRRWKEPRDAFDA